MPPTTTRQPRTTDSIPVRLNAQERAKGEKAAAIAGTTISQLARTGMLREAHRIETERAATERAIERAAERAAAERAGQ